MGYIVERFVQAQSWLEVDVQSTTDILNETVYDLLFELIKQKPHSTARLKVHMPRAF